MRRRGAGWEYLYREVDPYTGKPTRLRSKGGFATRAEAQAVLATVLATMSYGSYVSPAPLTLSQFLELRWLPAVVPTHASLYAPQLHPQHAAARVPGSR